MRLSLAALLAIAGWTLGAHAKDDVAACAARRDTLIRQVDQYAGDPMLKRVMQADLARAQRELLEGDADECDEALDHATKLLSGRN